MNLDILIFGSNGMLGTELMRTFAAHKPICLTSNDVDVTDGDAVRKEIEKIKPGIIINAAAYTNVDGAEQEEGKKMAYALNADAVGNMARACARLGIILVHFSTDYVFDGAQKEGYNEAASPNPLNEYGKSKLLGEQLIQKNTRGFYIIRLSRLFGKAGTSARGKKSFVDAILELARTRPQLKVVNNRWGKPTYAPDLAQAVCALIAQRPPYGIYHLPNEGVCTWHEFAQEILSLANLHTPIIPVPSSEFPRLANEPAYSILCNTKRPLLRHWKNALKEYLDHTA